ncbi:hypothetical protein Tco_0221238 [Tanacetum coccineum]
MVNTRNTKPHVLDEVLRTVVLEVIQEANVPVNAVLTTLQTNMNTLTDRIQALMMFQTFATGELTRISSGEEQVTGEMVMEALGWLLEEIHVTWAHLEKKRTRLRLYTKNHEELFTQGLEMASQP